MILAELDTPVIELPGVNGIFRTPFNSDQPLYSRSRQLKGFCYGDSVNSELSAKRLLSIIARTGREIHTHIIPEKTDTQKKSEKCGFCHELGKKGCVLPARCSSSIYNHLCGHTDNAGVYPGIETLLHILHIGGVLTEADFIQHTAWLRMIAHKLLYMDAIARWSGFICTAPGGKDDKYFELFGVSADERSDASDIPDKLTRNKQWQSQLSAKVSPYIDSVQDKIRRGMEQDWELQNLPALNELVAIEIRTTIEKGIGDFWTMDYPK